VPFSQITVVPESRGTTTVVSLAGGGGLLLLMHPAKRQAAKAEAESAFNIKCSGACCQGLYSFTLLGGGSSPQLNRVYGVSYDCGAYSSSNRRVLDLRRRRRRVKSNV
jgi:hypothetical protein